MKQRFSSLDVKVIAYELSSALSTLRLANVYDLSSRIFLLKFAKSDHKEQLVIDSGFRCHLTNFTRTTAAAPSAFVARLRRYLRSRRVTGVSQVGTDRIIDFQFSDGQYHLFLEFYAAGNIILTDGGLEILALFRTVSEGAEGEQVRVGAVYSISERQNAAGIPSISKERLNEGLRDALSTSHNDAAVPGQKAKRKAVDPVKKALASAFPEFPSVLLDHVLLLARIDTSLPLQQYIENETLIQRLLDSLESAKEVVESTTRSQLASGYIVAKPRKANGSGPTKDAGTEAVEPNDASSLLYEDFHPFEPQKFVDDPTVTILRFEGFNKTVDEYFSSIEGQKLESRLQDRQETARRKLDNVRKDHMSRLAGLQGAQQLNVRKAQAIEANILKVEETMGIVNGLIAQGMDWVEIARLIELEQTRQNPLAERIKLPLKLYENTITLLLSEWDDEDGEFDDRTESEASDSDEDTAATEARRPKKDNRLTVDIDLGLSPWVNAREYYDQKRSAAEKAQKTLQQASKALKNTEKKISADLAKGIKQEKELLRPVRKQLWFEKFIFFVSSEGYLVLGGRDAQQSEILYKRYFKNGDVYVHAELEGAASVFIKNNPSTPEAPIPPSTLSQAGTLSVATSNAWDSKAVMSAWWVLSAQVSKAAPTGDYLPLGQFAVRGKKNFLPPAQLVLGFGVLFQVSEESGTRHRTYGAQAADICVPESVAEREAGDSVLQSQQSIPDPGPHEHSANDTDEGETPEASDASSERNNESHGAGIDEPDILQGNPPKESESPTEIAKEKRGAGRGKDNAHEDETLAEPTAGLAISTSEAEGGPSDQQLGGEAESHGDAIGVDDDAGQGRADESLNVEAEAMKEPYSPSGQQQKPVRQVRGKRGKQKKIASKYRDQDDEDRALAMKILGSAAGQAKAEEETKARQAREEKQELDKKRRREQHLRAAKKGLEQEEARQKKMAQEPGNNQTSDHVKGENTGAETDEDKDSVEQLAAMSILSSFVGKPLPGDELISALPVCAPWSAMGNYKYKAKLQPGSQKKGKAIKEILGRWLRFHEQQQRKPLTNTPGTTPTTTTTTTTASTASTAGQALGSSADPLPSNKSPSTSSPSFPSSSASSKAYQHQRSSVVDDSAQDPDKMWPKELELIKAWRETELFNTVPVGKIRVMTTTFASTSGGGGSGGGGGKGGGGGGTGGAKVNKSRGGKGSKKDRR